jgi:hypothetical protein
MAMMLYSGLDWSTLIWDLLAALLVSPTPETISTHVTYTAVDPMVIYSSFATSAGAVIVSICGIATAMINRIKTAGQIQEVHVLVNKQLEAYRRMVADNLILEKASSRAEGKAEGREDQKTG